MSARVVGTSGLVRRLDAVKPQRIGTQMMRRLGLRAVREQKLLVRRKTGNLGRSIHLGSVTATSAETVASARYAGAVEFGSRAHDIVPRVRKALRWAARAGGARLTGTPTKAAQRGAAGGVLFAKIVHHPGTKPYPFMAPGARKAIESERLTDDIIEAWNQAG